MLPDVFAVNLCAGFLSLAKIQPRLGLEWDEVHCVKNRYPIYYGFPLAQELVIRIIQQNRRQAGYFMVQWQWRKYRIIRKGNCISATGKQLYHVGIIPALRIRKSVKLRFAGTFISMLVPCVSDI